MPVPCARWSLVQACSRGTALNPRFIQHYYASLHSVGGAIPSSWTRTVAEHQAVNLPHPAALGALSDIAFAARGEGTLHVKTQQGKPGAAIRAHLATDLLPARLLVVHDARRGGQHNDAKLRVRTACFTASLQNLAPEAVTALLRTCGTLAAQHHSPQHYMLGMPLLKGTLAGVP